MHLWPTLKLRDSFKISYLKNLEWNFRRMEEKDQQSQSSNQQNLLNNEEESHTPKPPHSRTLTSIFHDLLLLLSCCYCCFCCGACVEEN